jgi:hypothetical protein
MEVEKMDKAEYLDKYEDAACKAIPAAEEDAKAYIDVLEHEGPALDCMAARLRFEQMTTPWLVLELIAAKRELDALKAERPHAHRSETGYPREWMTLEPNPRQLTVVGRSAVDPDCLVAYADGQDKPLWIVTPSGLVCGLGQDQKAYARPVE